MTARTFSRDTAAATLPLVRRIVADIQRDSESLERVLPHLKEARIQSRRQGPAARDLEPLRLQVADITTRFEGYLAELAQVGCLYRGSTGHVDFRSEEDGRPMFLCWYPGESEVGHGHGLDGDCRRRCALEDGLESPVAAAWGGGGMEDSCIE